VGSRGKETDIPFSRSANKRRIKKAVDPREGLNILSSQGGQQGTASGTFRRSIGIHHSATSKHHTFHKIRACGGRTVAVLQMQKLCG